MPHMRSLPVLIVENPPFHPQAGQRHTHEIRKGAVKIDRLVSAAPRPLVISRRNFGVPLTRAGAVF
jgi:hypothetical protein